MADKKAIETVQQEEKAASQEPVNGRPSSIPDRTLEIRDFDPDEMTLDEAVLFERDGFTAKGFRQFLYDHSNWTKAEIGKIKVKDLKLVADAVVEKLGEIAVPNAS